ncbi:MAG TPA: replication initiator [Jiangellaceae bacterium]
MTAELLPFDPERMVADAALTRAEDRARGCAKPIRLVGSTVELDTTTGEVLRTYSSDDELDGYTYVRCGNRRASVCPSCSREYKGDAWHLLACGLAGGRDIPESVADHPATFGTVTAPSFGSVHRRARKKRGAKAARCQPRRDRPMCDHGRPAYCGKAHHDDDPQVGQPLCWQCYDYTGHVLWQWHAPELWRRLTIALQRQLAHMAGIGITRFRKLAKVSFVKVVEFQARGIIHVHAPIRLDGPEGPTTPPVVQLTTDQLGQAFRAAAESVALEVPGPDNTTVILRWGRQIDTRPITGDADREGNTGPAHPHQVAAYLGKYLTKSTEDFGLPEKIRSATDARLAGASPHAVRIIQTATALARVDESYARLRDRLATLGYRGHPITKSRRYSITFGTLRRARSDYRRRRARLEPGAHVRDVLDPEPTDLADDTTVLILRDWTFEGVGYLDSFTAVMAVESATQARSR